MNRDDVRRAQDFVERQIVRAGFLRALGRKRRPPRDNLHAEGARDRRDLDADFSHAENAERLASEHVAQNERPLAAAHRRVARRDAPHDVDHEAEGELRDAVAAGRERDDDAGGGRRLHIDMIGVIAGLRDELQIRQRAEKRRREARALADRDHGLHALQRMRGVVLGSELVRKNLDPVPGFEPCERRRALDRALIIVEDGDVHFIFLFARRRLAAPFSEPAQSAGAYSRWR